MAVGVFRAIRENHQLLVQAPTGIGKTMAAVFPAIKALGKNRVNRIFYLAARSTGKQVAEEAFDEEGKLDLTLIDPLGYCPADRTYRAVSSDPLGSYGYSRKTGE